MPRRAYKGRTKLQRGMSFRKMCDLVGIKPLQRVKLIKIMQENLKNEQGVDNT